METLREKIISLEFSNTDDIDMSAELNGDEDGDDDEIPTTPISPTPSDEPGVAGKKKKRKRTKKGKN